MNALRSLSKVWTGSLPGLLTGMMLGLSLPPAHADDGQVSVTSGEFRPWGGKFKVRYRYRNRMYKKFDAQICNQKEHAIRLAKAMDATLNRAVNLDEFSELYKTQTNLKKNHPNCAFWEKTKGVNLDVIATEEKHFGILRIAYYKNDRRYILYHLYMKKFNDFRIYDTQEQLIGLIESGVIAWESLYPIEKQAIWDSFDANLEGVEYTKKLKDVLITKGLVSDLNEFSKFSLRGSSSGDDAVLRDAASSKE